MTKLPSPQWDESRIFPGASCFPAARHLSASFSIIISAARMPSAAALIMPPA